MSLGRNSSALDSIVSLIAKGIDSRAAEVNDPRTDESGKLIVPFADPATLFPRTGVVFSGELKPSKGGNEYSVLVPEWNKEGKIKRKSPYWRLPIIEGDLYRFIVTGVQGENDRRKSNQFWAVIFGQPELRDSEIYKRCMLLPKSFKALQAIVRGEITNYSLQNEDMKFDLFWLRQAYKKGLLK